MITGRFRTNYIIAILTAIILLGSFQILRADFSLEKKLSLYFQTGARQPALNPTWQPWVISPAFGAGVGYGLNEEVMLIAEFEYGKVYNDSISHSTYKIGKENANEYWKISALRFKVKYYLIGNHRFLPYVTGGMGLAFWSIRSNYTGDKLIVKNEAGNSVEYGATEFLLCGGVGYEYFIRDDISINVDASFNYLTGVGADFSQDTEDYRSRGFGDIKFGVSFYFGLERGSISISTYEAKEKEIPLKERMAVDSDLDGVPNKIDLCPDTPPEASGMVDAYGCPIDSDGDGLPDYLDKCPFIRARITADSTGCPPDGDNDSVADSLDACPDTPSGYIVDDRGCPLIDSIFASRIMYVQFSESGRGIDFRSVSTLDTLARALNDFPDVKVAIKAYTDNVLPMEQSKREAENEALRIKGYLVERRISGERIEAIGMGATEFIDTNTTAEGRARNHRIKLEFIY